MTSTVPLDTLLNIKKRQQISFRRWINGHAGDMIEQYIGCDKPTCRQWISNQFIDGMHWNNYGSLWVIDHIIPVRLFDLRDSAALKVAWNYHNLIPLLKEDNLYKEGNLSFSIQILTALPVNEITNKLLIIAREENKRLDKYIIDRTISLRACV